MAVLNSLKKVKNTIELLMGACEVKGCDNSLNFKLLQKNKARVMIEGNSNRIELPKGWKKPNIKIVGNNNQIICGEDCCCHKFQVSIYGDNNKVFIGSCVSGLISVDMGFAWHNKMNNGVFEIGDNSSFNGMSAVMLEPESFIKIGKDCLFSGDIELWASDTHSVIDLDGKLINYVKGISIGEHTWVGKGVKIGKSAAIAGHSIVGWHSVVTGKFAEPNVVIAGNPAKVVKTGVDWSRLSPYNYLQQNK